MRVLGIWLLLSLAYSAQAAAVRDRRSLERLSELWNGGIEKVQQSVDQTQQQIQSKLEELSEDLVEIGQKVQEHGQQLKTHVGQGIDQVQEHANEFQEEAQQLIDQAGNTDTDDVRGFLRRLGCRVIVCEPDTTTASPTAPSITVS